MNSLENIGKLLKEHLEDYLSVPGLQRQNNIIELFNPDYNQRCYDSFFNWLTDPTHSPESIIHLLDTYIRQLDGFSINESIQTLVSFSCLEALARRRPMVLEGQWERIAWIVVKYSTCSNTMLENALTNFKAMNEETIQWIVEFSTPEICPNPCLRLELFRLLRSFNRSVIDYDIVSFRDKIIKTLVEVSENYSSLTVDQLPIFSPMDLQFVIREHNIGMAYLMTEADLYPIRYDIIIPVLKLTRDLVLIEKVRKLSVNSQQPEWAHSIGTQLYCCSTFCGLIPPRCLILPSDEELELEYNDSMFYFVQTLGNDPLLVNIVMQTLDRISDVSLCFPGEHNLHDSVTSEKDKLLHRLFKDQINQLHTYQYIREINGGFNPAAEYRLRYFQSNTLEQYNDSETENYFEFDISDD